MNIMKQEMSDKQVKETNEKVTEAADAVKEGAKEVSVTLIRRVS